MAESSVFVSFILFANVVDSNTDEYVLILPCLWLAMEIQQVSISPRSIPVLPDGRLIAKDAADYLGVSPKTMAVWRCEGRGPRFVKFGRIFYFQQDLDAWVAQHQRVTSTRQTSQNFGPTYA